MLGLFECGGKVVGYFIGVMGVIIYKGDNWEGVFDFWVIVGDVGSNFVYCKCFDLNGFSYIVNRIDMEFEFIILIDNWFCLV